MKLVAVYCSFYEGNMIGFKGAEFYVNWMINGDILSLCKYLNE